MADRRSTGRGGGDYGCALTRDLAWRGRDNATDWQVEAAGNTRYLAPDEATRALDRAGLGPDMRGRRAARRADGEFRESAALTGQGAPVGPVAAHVALSLRALSGLADALAPAASVRAAFRRALSVLDALDDAVFAGVAGPQVRFRIEAL